MRQGYLPPSAAERGTGRSSSRLHPPRSSLTPAPHLLDHLSVHPAPHPAARHHAHKDPAKEGLQAGRGRSMGTRRSLALSCQWRQQAGTTGIPNQLPVRLHSRGSPTSSPTPCPAAATIRTLNLAGALPACTVLPICMTPALGPSVTPPIMGAGPPNTPAGWETGAQVGRKDQLRRLTEQELCWGSTGNRSTQSSAVEEHAGLAQGHASAQEQMCRSSAQLPAASCRLNHPFQYNHSSFKSTIGPPIVWHSQSG